VVRIQKAEDIGSNHTLRLYQKPILRPMDKGNDCAHRS